MQVRRVLRQGVVAGEFRTHRQLFTFQCFNHRQQGCQLALLLEAQLGAWRRWRRLLLRRHAGYRWRHLRGGFQGRGGSFTHGARPCGLCQPIHHPAFVFAPGSRAFKRNRACHHVVQKTAVVAYQKNRAFVSRQQLFEQFERVNVQVIGRLVQHQYVGWPREQTRQQQAISLPARQRAHG